MPEMQLNRVETERINKLTDALDKIFLKESTQLSFVQGYSDCYMIVIQNLGEYLYNSIKNVMSAHLRDRVQPLVTQDLANNCLEVINKKWVDLDECVRKFHDILLFLDSNYAQPKNLLEVYDMGLQNFRNLILRNEGVSESMQHVMFGMIIAEREGNTIDNSTIKTAVKLLLSIGEEDNQFSEYDDIFEKQFLENSELFYKREAQKMLQKNNAVEYIKAFENRLAEEKGRILRYLHERTESKILQLVENVLIKENLNNIIQLEYGLNWMIQEDRISELEKIYKYFKKYSQINEFNQITGQCFSVYANSIVDCVGGDIDIQEKSEVIEKLLELKLKYDNLASKCFDNNIDLKAIVENMFTLAMNSKAKISEYLAYYVHGKMGKYEKNSSASDSQIDKELDLFIELFKLVTEKDVFEKYYNISLERRLLSLKANLDIENKFIGKLQLECGNDFIKKLKNMADDIIINQTNLRVFNEQMNTQKVNLPEIDFSIYILRSGAWQSCKQFPEINLPSSMNHIYNLYLKYYKDKHSERQVKIQCNMGNTHIKAHYEPCGNKKKREYILEGTTLHAIVLDLFNYNDNLSLNEIQAKTNIPEISLDLILTQLVKNKILNIVEKNDGVIKIYSVNSGFSSKSRRYKIKGFKSIEANRKDNREENEAMKKQILSDRNIEIDAAIVRVMKTRKTLQVSMLHAEIIDILKKRFTPSVDVIKLRIKYLIEREYIKYVENDTKTIIYID